MNCNEIRELISCMLDHELSAEDSAIVTEHLADCPECMRAFEAFHAISLSLEELEEVPAGFTEDVMNRIHESKPTQKKKRGSLLRMTGMLATAACVALVMMAGTRFASTHMYVGGGNGDVAETAQVKRTTPTPASVEDVTTYTIDYTDRTPADAGITVADTDASEIPSGIGEPAQSDGMVEINMTPTPEIVVTATPEAAMNMVPADPTPTVPPSPAPSVTPTPIPPMQLMFTDDLLIVIEEADFNLFTEAPAYTLTVTDANGNPVELQVWIDGTRIYCRSEAEGTAWYTVGTPAELTALLGEPLPTPAAETSPTPNDTAQAE